MGWVILNLRNRTKSWECFRVALRPGAVSEEASQASQARRWRGRKTRWFVSDESGTEIAGSISISQGIKETTPFRIFKTY
jgi:hypothetical protein